MADEKGTGPAHHPGAGKGEEVAQDEGKEMGRHDKEQSGADRPAGGRTARDSTRINPDKENPIDDKSPNLPPS